MQPSLLSDLRLPLPAVFLCALSFLLPGAVSSAAAAETGTITGRVSNAASGALLEGAEVTVVGTSLRAVTDRDGSFVLTKVPAGPTSLHVYYTGLDPFDKRIEVGRDRTESVNVVLNQNIVELQAF